MSVTSIKLDSANPCPNCGKLLDGASTTQPNTFPKPGDITICIYCAQICTFDAGMKLEKMTPDLFNSLDMDNKMRILAAVKLIKGRYPRGEDN